jgi:hypothetical protein
VIRPAGAAFRRSARGVAHNHLATDTGRPSVAPFVRGEVGLRGGPPSTHGPYVAGVQLHHRLLQTERRPHCAANSEDISNKCFRHKPGHSNGNTYGSLLQARRTMPTLSAGGLMMRCSARQAG